MSIIVKTLDGIISEIYGTGYDGRLPEDIAKIKKD